MSCAWCDSCPECGSNFVGRLLYCHLFDKHGYVKEEIERIKKERRDLKVSLRTRAVLKCDKCDATYSSKQALATHKSDKHPSKRPLKCPLCKEPTQKYEDLVEHARLAHDTDESKLDTLLSAHGNGDEEKSCSKTDRTRSVCNICGREYLSLKAFRSHRKRHRLMDGGDSKNGLIGPISVLDAEQALMRVSENNAEEAKEGEVSSSTDENERKRNHSEC
ncbi:zinc finger, C2H2 type, partial [Cooperia oncophora]